jgi:hypothetical protein
MNVDKKHWISNGAELVQSGDLVRLRGYDGEWSEWGPADHLAGSRVDSFANWDGMGIQFARVPAATTEQPRRFADELQRWQQESAPEPQWEMVSDRDYILRPGVDQVRCRTYLNESEHWSEWTDWHTVQKVQTVGGFADGPGGTAAAQEWQFRRRVTDARPAVEPAPKQPPAPTPDRGSKYHRTIRQSLPGDTHGLSLTVDVYDVLQAFGVTCPALQHAAKKILCAGLRGAKGAEQDISEAANSCRRAIELLEFEL